MELEHLINREPIGCETVAAGETIKNVQLCPVGDFPNNVREQYCTEEALENVVNRWKAQGSKEVLVDFEHKCEAGGTSDTSAAAWASNLRVEKNRGLVADFKVTDLGAEALTNKPNIPVAPVLNREDTGVVHVAAVSQGPQGWQD